MNKLSPLSAKQRLQQAALSALHPKAFEQLGVAHTPPSAAAKQTVFSDMDYSEAGRQAIRKLMVVDFYLTGDFSRDAERGYFRRGFKALDPAFPFVKRAVEILSGISNTPLEQWGRELVEVARQLSSGAAESIERAHRLSSARTNDIALLVADCVTRFKPLIADLASANLPKEATLKALLGCAALVNNSIIDPTLGHEGYKSLNLQQQQFLSRRLYAARDSILAGITQDLFLRRPDLGEVGAPGQKAIAQIPLLHDQLIRRNASTMLGLHTIIGLSIAAFRQRQLLLDIVKDAGAPRVQRKLEPSLPELPPFAFFLKDALPHAHVVYCSEPETTTTIVGLSHPAGTGSVELLSLKGCEISELVVSQRNHSSRMNAGAGTLFLQVPKDESGPDQWLTAVRCNLLNVLAYTAPLTLSGTLPSDSFFYVDGKRVVLGMPASEKPPTNVGFFLRRLPRDEVARIAGTMRLKGAEKVEMYGLVRLDSQPMLTLEPADAAFEVCRQLVSKLWNGSFEQFAGWMQRVGCELHGTEGDRWVTNRVGNSVRAVDESTLGRTTTVQKRAEWFERAVDQLHIPWGRLMGRLMHDWHLRQASPAQVLNEW